MSRFLRQVETSFTLIERGIILAPFIDKNFFGDVQNGHCAQVRLVRPDESEIVVEANFYWQRLGLGDFDWVCLLPNQSKEIAPPGTQIYLLED